MTHVKGLTNERSILLRNFNSGSIFLLKKSYIGKDLHISHAVEILET